MLTDNLKCLNKILPILILIVLSLLFFSPVIFDDRTFFAFDTLLTYLPWSSEGSTFRPNNTLITDPVNMHYLWHQFIRNCIEQKILPLWNGLNFGGHPFSTGYTPHGNPVAFLCYLFLPLTVAHDCVLWFHLCGAGLFMFLYLRQMTYKSQAALMGAVAWMFNCHVIVFFEIESVPIVAFALPAALLFVERWLAKRAFRDCLLFVTVQAAAIGGGHTHLIILQHLFIGSYALYRYFTLMRKSACHPKMHPRHWGALGLAIVLLGLLSANFITSHLMMLEDPQRSTMSFDALYRQTGKLPPQYLLTMIFPDLYGNPAGNITFTPRAYPTQVYNNYSELCIYTGVLTLFLVTACLPYLRRSGPIRFYIITATASLTMAMGSLLYYPLTRLIPGLDFSSPTRILFIFGFCMSFLAAGGADILTRVEDKKKPFILAVWISLLCITAVIALLMQTETGIKWATSAITGKLPQRFSILLQHHFALGSPTLLKPLLLTLISFLTLACGLYTAQIKSRRIFLFVGLLILAYDLVSFGLHYNTTSPRKLEYPETGAIRFLKTDKSKFRLISFGKFLHNSFGAFNLTDVGGYHSFYPKRYGEFLHVSQYGPDTPLPDRFHRWTFFRTFGSPLLDLINVKYVLLPPGTRVQSSSLKSVYDEEIKIYENMNVFPRAFWVPSYTYCPDRQTAYETLGRFDRNDFKDTIILESRPPSAFNHLIHREGNRKMPAGRSQIDFVYYGPNKIEMTVLADQDGFVVLSDNYHPAWQAEIDGKKSKILRANYIMRAIAVKSGRHRIEFSFEPRMLMAGMILSALAWIALAVLIARSFLKKHKTTIQQDPPEQNNDKMHSE